MNKLIFSIALVVLGIGIGYVIQVFVNKKQIALPMDAVRKKLQQSALLILNPIAFLGATWVADIHNIKIAAMPFMGMAALFSGGCLAFAASKALHLNQKQTGSYIICGGFTNIGSLGALFCFIFLGETGFALVPFYKLFEEVIYYTIGFPIAKSFSDDLTETPSFVQRLKAASSDIFVVVAVCSITLGLILNMSGLHRPEFYADINAVFIPLAALLLLISIGMAMKFSSIRAYLPHGLIIATIKFLLVPLLVVSIGYLSGLDKIDNGLPLKVVLILSSMPVGFIAMVPPTIYDLDIDLANSCWLVTNGALLLEIPLLLFLVNFI